MLMEDIAQLNLYSDFLYAILLLNEVTGTGLTVWIEAIRAAEREGKMSMSNIRSNVQGHICPMFLFL